MKKCFADAGSECTALEEKHCEYCRFYKVNITDKCNHVRRPTTQHIEEEQRKINDIFDEIGRIKV